MPKGDVAADVQPSEAVGNLDQQDSERGRRMRAAAMLAAALKAAVADGPNNLRCLGHPWVCEYIAWQVEQRLFANAGKKHRGPDGDTEVGNHGARLRAYNARARAFLKSIRLEENQPVLASLFEGRLSPRSLVSIEAAGKLLPEGQRKRLAEEEAQAAERREREAKIARTTGALPFFSDKIQCISCETWGAQYERIPHVGGHHALGKTPSLGGTTHARIACACPSCGLRWKADEPP
mmetsp:Transcript_40209/g.72394  ORF Transcript_40209/g.72394 Transcript_40209/m.72394 type:complete len:236 (+) Transcript_40209:43-750(+)